MRAAVRIHADVGETDGLVTRAATHAVSVNLGTAKAFSLVVGDGGDGGYNDRADWGGLQITCGTPVSTLPGGPWPSFYASAAEVRVAAQPAG